MSPSDQHVVERKLVDIAERLTHRENFAKDGWEIYDQSVERRKATEKLLQEAIEYMIDINSHVLAEEGKGAPHDYFDSFLRMKDIGWLSDELAVKLAPAAGLRNRLVHQYSEVDNRRVFSVIQNELHLFKDYVGAIRAKLKPKKN